MDHIQEDINDELMVDGNAIAGVLQEIFTAEMTASLTECVNCGREGELGTLQAFIRGPGYILRCPTCQNVILRIVVSPRTIFLDTRGAVCLKVSRSGI